MTTFIHVICLSTGATICNAGCCAFARTANGATVTDTTDNISSANNLIRAGYRLFEPPWRWAFQNSLYWTKVL